MSLQSDSVNQVLLIGMGLVIGLFVYALIRDIFDDFGHKRNIF
jgi:hypothetical protein